MPLCTEKQTCVIVYILTHTLIDYIHYAKYCCLVHHQKPGHDLGMSTHKCMLVNQFSLVFHNGEV